MRDTVIKTVIIVALFVGGLWLPWFFMPKEPVVYTNADGTIDEVEVPEAAVEATDAPTDEATDAPTDEAADAPTDEAADAPTDEAADAVP